MRARLFLLFIFFILYSATSYISKTIFVKLKGQPFLWSVNNIRIVSILLLFVQFFSIFLGGFLAAFITPLWILLVVSFSNVIVAISIFEVASNGNSTVIEAGAYTSENYVSIVTIFFVLFGIYTGMLKFLFLVMILDQNDSKSIEFAMGYYWFCLNLSYLFVCLLLPFPKEYDEYYLYISLPLVLIATLLLLFGRWKKFYCVDSNQVDIIEIIHKICKLRIYNSSIFAQKADLDSSEPQSLEVSSSSCLTSSLEKSTQAFLSFSKLCIIFISLLPYGICDSQLQDTFFLQSNYLSQPKIDYYAMKEGFWVTVINCSGVLIFLSFFGILRNYNNFFKKCFSQFLPRIIASNLLMFLSILFAGITETIRLDIYWGSRLATVPSQNIINQTIDNVTYSAANISIFLMIPQLLFSSISEIFLVTTCGQLLYEQSVGSIKYLAMAFFLGAVISGGAGNLISSGLTILLDMKMFDPSNLNKRTFLNGTCCLFESRLDYFYYSLAGVFFLTIIFTTLLLLNFKHYYQRHYSNEVFVESDCGDNN